MTTQERNNIIKLQATLTAIEKGEHIFFNVTMFESLGLVKVWGKDIDNRTRYILTPKAKRYLSVQISDVDKYVDKYSRLLQTFILNEFAGGRMNTQHAIDKMIALVCKKLSISNKEAGEFIHEAING